MDRHAAFASAVPYTIDLDPNADLMCPMNSPRSVYCNFRQTSRQSALLLHMALDYRETENQIRFTSYNIDYEFFDFDVHTLRQL